MARITGKMDRGLGLKVQGYLSMRGATTHLGGIGDDVWMLTVGCPSDWGGREDCLSRVKDAIAKASIHPGEYDRAVHTLTYYEDGVDETVDRRGDDPVITPSPAFSPAGDDTPNIVETVVEAVADVVSSIPDDTFSGGGGSFGGGGASGDF